MNKPLQIGLLAAAIVIALGAIGFLLVRQANDGQGVASSEQREVLNALEKVGGDPSKLDATTKQKFDSLAASNPNSTVNRYGGPPGAAAGSQPGTPVSTSQGAPPVGGSGMPSNYYVPPAGSR